MPGSVRMYPNYNNARPYSLRTIVESHGVRESGWWIFKTRTPVIRVRVREDQLVAFNNIVRVQMSIQGGGHLVGIAPVLELGMTKKELDEYPVGSEVGITFGYSGPVSQFFHGTEPLKLMKLEVIGAGTRLENEVTPV